MPRAKTYRHNVWLKVNQLERAIVAYYSDRYQRPQTDIIRGMIKQYTRADVNFDSEGFRKFVETTLIPDAGDDEGLRTDIERRVEAFLAPLEKGQRSG